MLTCPVVLFFLSKNTDVKLLGIQNVVICYLKPLSSKLYITVLNVNYMFEKTHLKVYLCLFMDISAVWLFSSNFYPQYFLLFSYLLFFFFSIYFLLFIYFSLFFLFFLCFFLLIDFLLLLCSLLDLFCKFYETILHEVRT